MNVQLRQRLERMIARKIIRSALNYGHVISVNDGEKGSGVRSSSVKGILKEMFGTDQDTLMIHTGDGELVGTVMLIYGNTGFDVIADHSWSMVGILADANALSYKLAKRYGYG